MNNKKLTLIFSTIFLLVGCGNKDDDSAGTNINIDCAKLPCFFSVETQSGNLAGISGADALCQKKHSTAKAFIVDTTQRIASPANADWVLDANTEYYQFDGTVIGTTNASRIFTFPLTASLLNAGNEYWTGMATNYQNSISCSNWTVSTGVGAVGLGSTLSNQSVFAYNQNCHRSDVKLLCVAH